jgi:predicted nucleic acid-binding protein
LIGPFALDASTIGNWCFEDERTPEVEEFFQQLAFTYAVAPALISYELQNALRSAERRKRITSDEVDRVWKGLELLDIRLLPPPALNQTPNLLELSRRYGVTVYDASYLDVAVSMGLPLATRDKAMRIAARALGVPLLLSDPS